MTTSTTSRVIYPAIRAVEDAATLPGVAPLRLFRVLWPIWQVEISADIYQEQPYELIDRFIMHAVVDGGMTRIPDVAGLLGLAESLVGRCAAFLALLGQLQVDGERVEATDLGRYSCQQGRRFAHLESRQDLMIDQYTAAPFPRRHYDGAIAVLPAPSVPAERLADRTTFRPLFAVGAFRPQLLQDLAQQPDRVGYNLPQHLHNLRVIAVRPGFLPVYLVDTATSGLLAYSALGTSRDTFIERLCPQAPMLLGSIADERERHSDPRQLWTDWLRERPFGPGLLWQLPNGVWRVTLRPEAFGHDRELPVSQVGSFRLHRHQAIQLWCDQEQLRRKALLDRGLRMATQVSVRSREALTEQLVQLATLLELPVPDLDDLRRYAEQAGQDHRLAALDELE